MPKFLWHQGQWVEAVRDTRPPTFPYIIRDGMAPTLHMADGQTYDSKSKFRRVTRDHGLIEVGTDNVVSPKPKLRRASEDIAEAIEMLEQGVQFPPLAAVDDGDFKDLPMKIYDAPATI